MSVDTNYVEALKESCDGYVLKLILLVICCNGMGIAMIGGFWCVYKMNRRASVGDAVGVARYQRSFSMWFWLGGIVNLIVICIEFVILGSSLDFFGTLFLKSLGN